MLERSFDATGEIRCEQQRKHGKHENRSDVSSPSRWRVDHYRTLSCDAVAPDDDNEARDGYQRIESPPCIAQARSDSVAPSRSDNRYRMHPQEEDQTEHEIGH